MSGVLALIASRTTAVLAAVATAAVLLPAESQATVQATSPAARPAEVRAAPNMPQPGGIAGAGKAGGVSVPAAAAPDTGIFTVFSAFGRPAARTTVKTEPAPLAGIPLMADWNGDGVETPGRYDNGKWFMTNGAAGTRPREGRKPTMLLKAAGLRSEPPMSLPSATGSMPSASATAAPPLLPPADLRAS